MHHSIRERLEAMPVNEYVDLYVREDSSPSARCNLPGFLARTGPAVFDLWPKEDTPHGLHSCIGPGDNQFARHLV